MSMPRVTIRLPDDLRRAYEVADGGSRSALMRRVLLDAGADGEVEGVPRDLRKLAARERVVDGGRYARKRATFKSRLLGFYSGKWEDGAVTPTDAATLAASWRAEAQLYDEDEEVDGTPHEDLLEAVLDWYRANWSRTAAERPSWPDAGKLLRAAEIGEEDEAGGLGVAAELVETIEDHAEDGVDPSDAAKRAADTHGVEPSTALRALRASDHGPDPADGGEP